MMQPARDLEHSDAQPEMDEHSSAPCELDEPDFDADLFEAIRGGGEWRGTTFHRYERMVRSALRRQLGPDSEVDDLVQEAFLRFFDAAGRVKSASSLKNYLYSIAVYTARDTIRRRRRERRLLSSLQSPLAREVASLESPDARAALAQLATVLGSMRSEDRRAFLLRQVDDVDLTRVASTLGVSLSTARRRVRSAKRFVEKRAARSALLSEYVRTTTECERSRDGDGCRAGAQTNWFVGSSLARPTSPGAPTPPRAPVPAL